MARCLFPELTTFVLVLCWTFDPLQGPGGALLFDGLVLVRVRNSERPPTVGECASLVLADWGFSKWRRLFCRAGAFAGSSNSSSLQILKAWTHALFAVMGRIGLLKASNVYLNVKSSIYLI